MAFVQQKDKMDCGVAVVAMLADVTYEEANRAIPWRKEGRGTTTKHMVTALDTLRYEADGTRLRVLRVPKGAAITHSWELWHWVPSHSLVKVPSGYPNDRGWHWVMWKKGKIYDPARGVFKPGRYHRGGGNLPSSYLPFKRIGNGTDV